MSQQLYFQVSALQKGEYETTRD